MQKSNRAKSGRSSGNLGSSHFMMVIILPSILALAGCPREITTTDYDREAQVLLYERRCAYCHGNQGEVVTGPRSLRESLMTEEEVAEVTRTGIGTMPGFEDKMTPEEIEAVANYVVKYISGPDHD